MIGGGVVIDWAMPDDVTSADIGGVTNGLTDDRIQYWLGRAKRAILAAVPDLEVRMSAGRVAAEAPADVQVDLVLSKVGNPGGIRTIQESNGPTSGSVTYGGDKPGQMVLDKDQLQRLLGAPRPKGRAGGISMIPADAGRSWW